jgi:hypothetical protein
MSRGGRGGKLGEGRWQGCGREPLPLLSIEGARVDDKQ